MLTDHYLRVEGTNGRVFALGDCATISGTPLPPTASVAEQQGVYLNQCFNGFYHSHDHKSTAELPTPGAVRPAAGGA